MELNLDASVELEMRWWKKIHHMLRMQYTKPLIVDTVGWQDFYIKMLDTSDSIGSASSFQTFC